MIYLAYGSNLHIGQMQRRCPTAEVLGTSTLQGYRLVFNGVATIEPDTDRSVPVLLWTSSRRRIRSTATRATRIFTAGRLCRSS